MEPYDKASSGQKIVEYQGANAHIERLPFDKGKSIINCSKTIFFLS